MPPRRRAGCACELQPLVDDMWTSAGGPIVGYSDALCVYDKYIADRLMTIANDRGLAPQAAVLVVSAVVVPPSSMF